MMEKPKEITKTLEAVATAIDGIYDNGARLLRKAANDELPLALAEAKAEERERIRKWAEERKAKATADADAEGIISARICSLDGQAKEDDYLLAFLSKADEPQNFGAGIDGGSKTGETTKGTFSKLDEKPKVEK